MAHMTYPGTTTCNAVTQPPTAAFFMVAGVDLTPRNGKEVSVLVAHNGMWTFVAEAWQASTTNVHMPTVRPNLELRAIRDRAPSAKKKKKRKKRKAKL